SISDPELAAHYTAEYQNLLDTAIQQQDKISTLPTINIAAMASAAEQIVGPIKPQKPTDVQTSIELPWHLYLSPHGHAGWAHASLPVTNNGRTELWHTRLGFLSYGSVTENYALFKTLRAIWSEEYANKQQKTKIGEDRGPESTVPFRMSLDAGDRYEIVELSSNFAEFKNPDGSKYLPTPIETQQLMLSSLGAWLNLYGFWDTPSKLSIESWRHRGTMGRDHYVRVVYRGYLFPFGHKAVLVKVTERKFQKAPNGETVAYLRQHLYIIVREPEKAYPGEGQEMITDSLYSKPNSGGKKVYDRSGRQDSQARKTPFRRARITTLVTPDLDKAEDSDIGTYETKAFWPRVGGADFEFHFVAEDWEGNRFDFTAPLIFVKKDVIENGTLGKSWDILSSGYVDDWINNNDTLKRNTRPIFGQRIALADPSTPGSTTFETDSITIGVELNLANRDALLQKGKPHFYPTIERAKIRVKTLEAIAGKNESFEIELYPDYVKNGFSSGQVFAKFLDSGNNPAKIGLNFSSDNQKSGGLLAPNMNISGLSRSLGAVAGNLDSMAQGVMEPTDLFKDLLDEAKLFGAIKLSDIIAKVDGFASALDRVPKFQREVSGSLSKTSFNWNPLVKETSLFVPKDVSNCLGVSVSILTPLNGGTQKFDITAALHDFDLVIPFIKVPFSTVTLAMKSGEKADVNVVVGKPLFTDSLEFMNDITNAIPLDGFSDPPYMEIDSSGIRTGFSLAIPTIGLGMVTIQNVTLGAELGIPFIGRAMQFSFLFCEKENPFTATVYCIGGGGYFGLVVEPDGVASIDAAIEFGGSLALNIGIAAGAVYIMAGIYYQYVKLGDASSALSVYIRVGGSLCVLGIVTVSIEFRIDLTYIGSGKVEGAATLKIKIKIFFVKKTFSRTVTRKICGTANDPLVKDVISEDDWKNYLAAFAA
ncbi:MAG: hypothetical protein HGB11_10650, partial [Chlorobiales bacterium]|nr:hypothetical protein [Chlorobiales bacterium]